MEPLSLFRENEVPNGISTPGFLRIYALRASCAIFREKLTPQILNSRSAYENFMIKVHRAIESPLTDIRTTYRKILREKSTKTDFIPPWQKACGKLLQL